MNGVNGPRGPQNVSITTSNAPKSTEIQQSNFSRFKVAIITSVKKFLSGSPPSGTSNTSIHSRQVRPHSAPPQTPEATSNNSFDRALDQVKNQPGVKEAFAKVHTALTTVQRCKDENAHNNVDTDAFRGGQVKMYVAIKQLKTTVEEFNKLSAPELKLNSRDLESGFANRHSVDFGFADEDVLQLIKLENTLL